MTYKGRRSPLPEIAEELDVRWILEATMIHAGRHVRVTAQLVEGATNENQWAESYMRQARGILPMESEIATAMSHRRRGGTTDAAMLVSTIDANLVQPSIGAGRTGPR